MTSALTFGMRKCRSSRTSAITATLRSRMVSTRNSTIPALVSSEAKFLSLF